MKKSVMLFVLFFMLCFSVSEAKQLKDWVQKTVWEESNGWIYSVGKAPYNHSSSDEFLKSQTQATVLAINQLKSHLKTQNLVGFQVIDFEYSKDTYYVLTAVPSAKNKVEKQNEAKDWEWNFDEILSEMDDTEPLISKALKQVGIKELNATNQWRDDSPYDSSVPENNTFICGNDLYAYGRAEIKNKDLIEAFAYAKRDAQYNMTQAINKAEEYMLNNGEYVEVVTNLDRSEKAVANAQIADETIINNVQFILMKTSLENL